MSKGIVSILNAVFNVPFIGGEINAEVKDGIQSLNMAVEHWYQKEAEPGFLFLRC